MDRQELEGFQKIIDKQCLDNICKILDDIDYILLFETKIVKSIISKKSNRKYNTSSDW